MKFKYIVDYSDLNGKKYTSVIDELIPSERGQEIEIVYDRSNPQKAFRTNSHAFLGCINFLSMSALGLIACLLIGLLHPYTNYSSHDYRREVIRTPKHKKNTKQNRAKSLYDRNRVNNISRCLSTKHSDALTA